MKLKTILVQNLGGQGKHSLRSWQDKRGSAVLLAAESREGWVFKSICPSPVTSPLTSHGGLAAAKKVPRIQEFRLATQATNKVKSASGRIVREESRSCINALEYE